MKRTQMLTKMCDFYEEHYSADETYDFFFDKLLTMLEHSGMLPPFVPEIYYRSAQTSHPENPNQWEPEDETI